MILPAASHNSFGTKMPTRIGTIGMPPAFLLQLFLFLMQIMCFLLDYRKKQTKSEIKSFDD